MTTPRRLLLALALCACDAPSKEDVAGLQARVDSVASENARLAGELATLRGDLDKRSTASDALQAKLDDALARLDRLQKTVEAKPPEPIAPARPSLAGRAVAGTRYDVDIGDAFTDGSADAKVTLVMFTDFQCPFCARADKTIVDLQKDYGSALRIVAKHNPLPMHTNAEAAARAAEAAGAQGKYWEMHRKLFENSRALTATDLDAYAKDLGLDMKRFAEDRDDAATTARIEAHKKQAMVLGARGTPSWFINGKFLSGAQPIEAFKTVIDAEIAEADRLIAAGTPAARVYGELMKTASPPAGSPSP
ncbi:MAG: thioredoxin domain-containing protein [Nannocystaceae bacterium]|nr:thioredoxin domain-containing protein [Nannocystaceae bacterium]